MDRRQFIKKSGLGTLALGLVGRIDAYAAEKPARKQIEWSLRPKKWRSLGPVDLIPQVEPALQWTNQSLIKYGIAWTPGSCCMRAACMPAEACAHYYAMTGDETTLTAIKAAVRTFRKYRRRARGRRVPYEEIKGPVKLDFVNEPQSGADYTIEYEAISPRAAGRAPLARGGGRAELVD
ncbi:MAG: twin-arginine translocation signal domain-containing protein [Planctomycetota bacterium]|jgi:hypothetical protein